LERFTGKDGFNALKGYDTNVEVRDEVDSAFFVILQDLKASSK